MSQSPGTFDVNTDTLEPLHILGAGSLGLLWAAQLRLTYPSYPVRLFLRDHYRDKLSDGPDRPLGRQQEIIISFRQQAEKRDSGDQALSVGPSVRRKRPMAPRLVNVPVEFLSPTNDSMPTTASARMIRNVLVTTKAFQAVDAIQSIWHRLDDRSHVILMCNGALAVRDELRERVTDLSSNHPVIHMGWTTNGAFREVGIREGEGQNEDWGVFHVVQAGFGTTSIENYPSMASIWNRAEGLQPSISVESIQMERELWYKLAVNCVINPMTAIHQCTNGELLQAEVIPESEQELMRQVIREVALVIQKATPTDAEPATTAEENDMSEEEISRFVWKVARDTSLNKSSMLQDVLAKRLTEIDYLNGHIVEQGRKYGIDCPANQLLWDKVRDIQEAYCD